MARCCPVLSWTQVTTTTAHNSSPGVGLVDQPGEQKGEGVTIQYKGLVGPLRVLMGGGWPWAKIPPTFRTSSFSFPSHLLSFYGREN